MPMFFVTYACNSDRANNYSLIEANSHGQAHDQAVRVCKRNFAFVYPVEGTGRRDSLEAQRHDYRLTEVPLGPQTPVAAPDTPPCVP